MPEQIHLRVESTQDADAKRAIDMWQLAWASRVVLGEIGEDGITLIDVTLSDDWEDGPPDLAEWVRSKL